MSKGPKLNNITKNFTSRNSLGIDGVSNSIQRDLCPIVNTVTPRAFYWIFMVWNYYDYFINSGISKENWNLKTFDKPFLKKNDYYFILSNLLNDNSDRMNLVGKDKASADIKNNLEGFYEYNEQYFAARFGGMQYFNAGCLSMGFITDRNSDGRRYNFPRITETIGKPMAIAFEEIIKNTEYYKRYRLTNRKVPKDVLEELGKVLSLNLNGFDKCKDLLRKALFDPKKNINLDNTKLIQSAEYIKLLHEKFDYKYTDLKGMRKILYEYFSPRGEFKYTYNGELKEIMRDWEIVVGRQYFSISIELIWKYMLSILNTPESLEKWIENSLNSSKWSIDINKNLDNYIAKCKFSFEEREEMIRKGYRASKDIDFNIENAIKVLLSIYNRFKDRSELNQNYLELGGEISIKGLIDLVEKYKEKPVYEFIGYIMKKWIIDQHKIIAFDKMMSGRDGYYFECIDNIYIRKAIPEPEYQGIRLIQLNQVMKDLDMWSE